MAIESTLLGTLGAGKVTESRFWFRDARRYCDDISKDWQIPAGRHLFAWNGTRASTLTGNVTIDGTTFEIGSGNYGKVVGGYLYVDGPKTILATGTGSCSFKEDPYVAYVRVSA